MLRGAAFVLALTLGVTRGAAAQTSPPPPAAAGAEQEQADDSNPTRPVLFSVRPEWYSRTPDVTQAAVILRYWYDYSEIEIAESLKLTVSAVKSRLHRSRRALAGMWQDATPRPRTERRHHESPAF